ncbi:MAG: HDOD domain-containing protein [Thermodesulfobacteriota bacterium]
MAADDKEKLRKALREIKNLPTLPGIVAKLSKMAENPDTTTAQMGQVIGKDHILAAKLLKLVNSAFYGFPQRISSLSSAIILLGFNVIKSLIISASIFEIMEDQDVELWQHSLGCAVVCNVVAKRMGVSDPEEISTAGLIHDIGKVAVKMELPRQYAEINAIVKARQIPRREAELEVLGLEHSEVGSWLARSWNLPNKLVEPVAFHHDPGKAKEAKLAAAIVHFGDIMIRALGCGHGDDIWVPSLNPQAWELLKLTPAAMDEIVEEVEEKLWDVRGFSLDIKAELEANLQR